MKKGIQTINKSWEEVKNIISELKNIREGIKCRLDEAEGGISELDKVEKNSLKEQENDKRLKKN